MLSRNDIEREIGKGINIFPLKTNNIKENSINLTIGQNGWAKVSGRVYWYGENDFSLVDRGNSRKDWNIKEGHSCVVKTNVERHSKKFLILMPHATTIVETAEVIGVGNKIGGALHSKVGVVAKGVGHIGTMLGPGYCGHLMISLHNITDDIIALEVGSTFVSLTFDYLKTTVERTSSTVSGHVDKFSDLGIQIDTSTREYLTQDWKSNLDDIRYKMIESESYKEYKKYIRRNKWKNMKKYFSKRNIVAIIATITFFIVLLTVATYVDRFLEKPVWVERFWTIGCSGIVGSLIVGIYNTIRDN